MSALTENEVNETVSTSAKLAPLVLETTISEPGHCVLTPASEDRLIAFLATDENAKIVDPYNAETRMAFDNHSPVFRACMRQVGSHELVSHTAYLDHVAGMSRANANKEVDAILGAINPGTIIQMVEALKASPEFKTMLMSSTSAGNLSEADIERIVMAISSNVFSTSGSQPNSEDPDKNEAASPNDAAEPSEVESETSAMANLPGDENDYLSDQPAGTKTTTIGGNQPARRKNH